MKKRYWLLLLLCFALMISIVTNPSDKDEYAEWVGDQIKQEEGPLLGLLGGSLIKMGTTKKILSCLRSMKQNIVIILIKLC